MAISFVGSAVNSSSPNAGTSVDVSGVGIAANDLIIVAAAVGDTVSNGLAAPTEGGYSRVPGVAATLYANDTNDTNLDMYYKVAAGTETAVSFAAVGGTNASNAAVVMVFRGVDTTTPFDTNANTATGIDTSNADPPSHNWSGAAGGWTVIAASTGHTGGATAAFTFPAGYTTNAAQRAHNDTIDVLVGMGYETSPANPENPAAFSAATIGTASANSWAAVTMSLLALVSAPVTVTPGAASLTLTPFAPTVFASDNKTVTPGPATLTLTTFAPTVTATSGLVVTPGPASMTLTAFAPTVTTTAHQVVTPGSASLGLTTFAPTVVATDHKNVVPGAAALALTTFAPSVSTTSNVTVTPGFAALSLTTYPPQVTISGGAVSAQSRSIGWRRQRVLWPNL